MFLHNQRLVIYQSSKPGFDVAPDSDVVVAGRNLAIDHGADSRGSRGRRAKRAEVIMSRRHFDVIHQNVVLDNIRPALDIRQNNERPAHEAREY